MPDMMNVLSDFQSQVNSHARLSTLLRGWDKTVRLEPNDGGEQYVLVFQGARLSDIRPGAAASAGTSAEVTLRATESTLRSIFTGVSNPAELFLSGELQVFASDKDQVKLDAISLVLWG